MRIGTMRVEEARVHDTHEGYHQFHGPERDLDPNAPGHGSFKIFFSERGAIDDEGEERGGGWYWWCCFPGCMPDDGPHGPFPTSRAALQDADEWNPEFDD